MPAIVTVTLFAFITSWNEFLGALVMMSKASAFTLPVILAAARTETSLGGTDWGMLQAGDHDLDHPLHRRLPPAAAVLRVRAHSGGGEVSGTASSHGTGTRGPGLRDLEAWFVTGSQHLYGDAVLQHVAEHARQIAGALDEAPAIPVRIVRQAGGHHARAIAAVLPRGRRRARRASA